MTENNNNTETRYRLIMGWNRDYSLWIASKRITPWFKTWDEMIDAVHSMGLSFTPGDHCLKKQANTGLGIPVMYMTNDEINELASKYSCDESFTKYVKEQNNNE